MELTNPQHLITVVVIKYGCVVGQVPRKLSETVSFYWKVCEVTGLMVDQATVLGLECVYWFYSHQAYIERLKNISLQQKKTLLCDSF